MPASKKRKKQLSHIPHSLKQSGTKSTNRIIWVTTCFFGLAGLGVAFLATEGNTVWMVIGGIAGAILGAITGNKLQKDLPGK